MSADPIKVLIVDGEQVVFDFLSTDFTNTDNPKFKLFHSKGFDQIHSRLAEDDIDVVLMSQIPSDESRLHAVTKAQRINPSIPFLIHSSIDKNGQPGVLDFQAFVVSGETNSQFMEFAVHHAIQSRQIHSDLENLSMKDELTGLSNRREFHILANQQIKLIKRQGKGAYLLFVDLDDLKLINDNYGHIHGDYALMDAANVLKMTFRDSDVVARFGGDEFVILAFDVEPNSDGKIMRRLRMSIDDYNMISDRNFTLSMSVGAAYLDPNNILPLETLIAEADRNLCESKRIKHKNRHRRPTAGSRA